MTVNSTSSPSVLSNLQANPAGYSTRAPKQVLGSDDFMKLLSTQMAHQDPMSPMQDTDFIAQMASFSSLAQMNQLSKDFGLLRSDQTRNTANSYLGKTVTVQSGDSPNGTITGEVTGIDFSGDEPLLLLGEKSFSLGSVVRVSQGGTTAAGSPGA